MGTARPAFYAVLRRPPVHPLGRSPVTKSPKSLCPPPRVDHLAASAGRAHAGRVRGGRAAARGGHGAADGLAGAWRMRATGTRGRCSSGSVRRGCLGGWVPAVDSMQMIPAPGRRAARVPGAPSSGTIRPRLAFRTVWVAKKARQVPTRARATRRRRRSPEATRGGAGPGAAETGPRWARPGAGAGSRCPRGRAAGRGPRDPAARRSGTRPR